MQLEHVLAADRASLVQIQLSSVQVFAICCQFSQSLEQFESTSLLKNS